MGGEKRDKQKHKDLLLNFLKQTGEGKYAKIEKSSLPYARMKIERQNFSRDEYYYSIR